MIACILTIFKTLTKILSNETFSNIKLKSVFMHGYSNAQDKIADAEQQEL